MRIEERQGPMAYLDVRGVRVYVRAQRRGRGYGLLHHARGHAVGSG
jgi:hypothetical protein